MSAAQEQATIQEGQAVVEESAAAAAAGGSAPALPAMPRAERDGEPILRVDCHTHILPESWPSLKEKYGYGGFIELRNHSPDGKWADMHKDSGEFFRRIESNCWSPARHLSDSDQVGVDVHVLSTVPVLFSYWAEPQDGLDVSMMLNDHMASCVATDPRRFVGLGTLPMQDPDMAVMEMKRGVRELGLSGFEIGSHVNDKTLDHESLFKVFKTAEELGTSLFIHPWDMVGKDLMSKYWMPWLVGMPAECSMAMCSLMMGGVLDRCPDLRIMIAHGGGSLPGTLGRIQHGWDVRPDICATDSPHRSPRDYMGTFWSDTLTHDRTMLDYIVELYGEDKVCMGTDYPFPLGEYTAESKGTVYAAGQLVDSMEWQHNLRKRVLGTNALEFLGKDVKDFHR